jgi:hypothetical protein
MGSLAMTERKTGLSEGLRDDEVDEQPHAGGATAMQWMEATRVARTCSMAPVHRQER